MSEQASQEPTMEEILASIRRIISEDEPAADEAAVAVAQSATVEGDMLEPELLEPEDDILELTDPVEPPAETIGDLDVFEAPAPAPVFVAEPIPAPAPAPAPQPAPRFEQPATLAAQEPLVSGAIAAATASAFGTLSQRIAMPSPTTSLDDVVRELLRPLLKDWLDKHLAAIVQAKVEEEVERLARRHLG